MQRRPTRRSCFSAILWTAVSFCLLCHNALAFSATAIILNMSYIAKLALILVRGRRQLVARSRGKTVFFTPGGKRELGESDEEALRRECKEEATVALLNIQPYGVC